MAGARPVFAYDKALELCAEMWQFSMDLQTTAGTRAEARNTCIGTWEGVHGEDFWQRSTDEDEGLGQAVAGLQTEALQWAAAWQDAVLEMNNVMYAEAVEQQRQYESDQRNLLEKGWNWLSGGGDDFGGVDVPNPPTVPTEPDFSGGAQFAHFYRSGDNLRVTYRSYEP